MDIFASLFAGLGLFFIGIRMIGANLKQMAGRKLRLLIRRAVAGPGSTAVFGLLAGAIMQSVNAVTYVLVALVSAGAIEKRRAFPVVSWANLGTSMLVLMAALNMHLFILTLIGMTGAAYYLNLDQSTRHRHIVNALLGVGLLFLGVDFIKIAAHELRDSNALHLVMAMAGRFWLLSFLTGVAVAMLIQSSTTVTVLAMAMAEAGLLPFFSGAMVVVGAGLGSGLSALPLAGRMRGSARQLVLYQLALKAVGVAGLLAVFLVDWLADGRIVVPLFGLLHLSRSGEMAGVYVALQLASTLCMALLERPILRVIEAQAPPSAEEVLGRPVYLSQDALADAGTAILVAEREQARLLASLPDYLAALREEASASDLPLTARLEADTAVIRECTMFLAELADAYDDRDVREQVMGLRDRGSLIVSLQNSLVELHDSVNGVDHHAMLSLIHSLVESLHMVLEALAEAAASMDREDLDVLRVLTHDRSELMNNIRRRMQGDDMLPDVQQRVFEATTIFERCMWLLRRYVLQLDAPADTSANPKERQPA